MMTLLLLLGLLALVLVDRYVPVAAHLRMRMVAQLNQVWQRRAMLYSTGLLLVLCGSAAVSLLRPDMRPATSAVRPAEQPTLPVDEHAAVVAVIQTFNEASIAASAANDLTQLAPFVVSDSPAWQVLRWRYEARLRTGERHVVTLTRFATLPEAIRVTDDQATVLAQEQWNDRRLRRDGSEQSRRSAIVLRQHYQLRRTPAGEWRIWSIVTDVVDGGH